MKKLLSIILASTMVMSLVACGGGNKQETTAPAGESAAESGAASEESSEAAVDTTYNIGVLVPLTGYAESYGNAIKNGCEIAISEINSNGGVQIGAQTCTLEMVAEDSTSTADGAVTAYGTLKTAGIDALIGGATTEEAWSVSEQATADKMFMISPSATMDDITKGATVHRICFTGKEEGDAAAQYAVDQNYESFAVLHETDNPYATEIYNEFIAKITELEATDKLVADEAYAAGATDFSTQLSAIQAAGAKLVFVPSYYDDAAMIVKQARDMGLASSGKSATDFLGTDGWDDILAQTTDTASLNGVRFMSTLDSSEEAASVFVNTYKSAYGRDANQYAADGYDAVYAIKAALEQAGSTDTDAVVKAMPSISVEGITGTLKFDESGETHHEIKYVEIEEGAYVPFYAD